MKVNLSSDDHEIAFQDLYPGFLKRPYLQRSVKMATRGDPLKIEAKSPRTWGQDLGFRAWTVGTNIRLLPQNRQDPNWEIRKTKNWPKSSGFPNLDPPNLQILEPPGSCRLQDFQILATGSANLEGPKSGNNWM